MWVASYSEGHQSVVSSIFHWSICYLKTRCLWAACPCWRWSTWWLQNSTRLCYTLRVLTLITRTCCTWGHGGSQVSQSSHILGCRLRWRRNYFFVTRKGYVSCFIENAVKLTNKLTIKLKYHLSLYKYNKFKGNSIALSVRPNTSPFSFPKKTDGI